MALRLLHATMILWLGLAGLAAITPASAQTRDDGATALLQKSAAALGGLGRIQAIRNITLNGYGQYAYMFGGGNITGSKDAPMKFEQANDLHRIYDLEHDRYRQLERRNFLFPFAIAAGHDFHPISESLDGEIAYNILPDGTAQRSPRWREDAHQVDGVHMRRMWSLNNPVAAIRAALRPDSKRSAVRADGADQLVDVVLAPGDKFTLAIDRRSGLPSFIRWANPQTNLGQMTMTTRLTGYTLHDGLMLPLGYATYMDWRNIPYLKIYVDSYDIDGTIADLAAPAALRGAEPPAPPAIVTSEVIAPGVWRLAAAAQGSTTAGTTAFEFTDHIMLFELNVDQRAAAAIIAFARGLAQGKPVTQVVVSHAHFDHAAGIRTAVANGLTVISRRNNEGILREMATHPAPDFPDLQARHPKPMKFIPVDEHLRLSDRAMTVDLYWARDNIHMADALFAYAPQYRLIAEADIATAAYDYQWWPDNYLDLIGHYKLDVERDSPVHSVSPDHPGVMTQAQVLEMIAGGVKRVRDLCADRLAKGFFFTGCPVHSNRY